MESIKMVALMAMLKLDLVMLMFMKVKFRLDKLMVQQKHINLLNKRLRNLSLCKWRKIFWFSQQWNQNWQRNLYVAGWKKI